MDVNALAPVLFLAHGSPMLALEGGDWGEAVAHEGQRGASIQAYLVCSAHWEADGPFRLSAAALPGVMHDFGGFPEPLYTLDYPAPGSPALAEAAADLLRGAGLQAELDPHRRLDHGAWVPLRYLAPEAAKPVVQLSLPRPRTPASLLAAGRALAPLRRQGVALIGSGGIVHNLGRLDWTGAAAAPRPWASAFQDWVDSQLRAGDLEALIGWRNAPGAAESVPTTEHLDPLFFALGASAGGPETLFEGWQLGSLSLTSYRFS
jgi:4,5-DOPA dioxygenase extradiol